MNELNRHRSSHMHDGIIVTITFLRQQIALQVLLLWDVNFILQSRACGRLGLPACVGAVATVACLERKTAPLSISEHMFDVKYLDSTVSYPCITCAHWFAHQAYALLSDRPLAAVGPCPRCVWLQMPCPCV